ncbi:MAG: hypothetical protein IBX52_07860 [Bacterioplanes sp.]|nr:hypothetical protein [Bacterioplanes sp.]
MSSPLQHAAFAAAICVINAPHVHLLTEQQQIDNQPHEQLRSKMLSWLRGELKSEANFRRFFDEFAHWREQLIDDDSLAYACFELTNAALYSACESLLDQHDGDDRTLLLGAIDDIHRQIESLGGDGDGLRHYWQAIQDEWHLLCAQIKQRPLPKTYFQWLGEHDVSLFGLSE